MTSICFYFEVHQPFRLRKFLPSDIGTSIGYFDDAKNREIIRKVGDRCYIPTVDRLLRLRNKFGNEFKVSFSLTGTVIEQLKEWYPEVLDKIKKLVASGGAEILSETYYHSLASLYSEREFYRQIEEHDRLMRIEFGVSPRIFRNAELIYTNRVSSLVSNAGYRAILTEGADRLLHGRSPNFVYSAKHIPTMRILTKNSQLSEDIAFRFSDKEWKYLLSQPDEFSSWIRSISDNGEIVNLFMDFENFGDHRWIDAGVFEFLETVPEEIFHRVFHRTGFRFSTPSETINLYDSRGTIDMGDLVLAENEEQDISDWVGNSMQQEALETLYGLEKDVYRKGTEEGLDLFGKLQTSDNFYYMSNRFFDRDHVERKAFITVSTPNEAFESYMNVLQDFKLRIFR
ncbi:glycoside hydrolase, family 57 [Leptospira inadai serovar Lyme str. 10]|uniref:Glycoside hydrolase, family 57 n=2 Tax=Leptospira inadai serovar Lyme TaxID=293084 RepID=V6H9U6_9LEPT|nr:glycoside hydrolase family 57 protein [Leptospira inadai]EQA36026.1 glycoside hydrolase, family 57 [Leptospira inadai serovar Lyme str. 10]PNV76977.1 alpha-amylase [Leptospira inadai serovar Lyme]